MNCAAAKKMHLSLTNLLTELLTFNSGQKIIRNVPYKAATNLYSKNYSWPPFQEYHCVNNPIKCKNNDSAVDHCAFGPTTDEGQWIAGLKTTTLGQ